MNEHERMTLAAIRLAEAWTEFWDSVKAYENAKQSG